MADAKPPKGTTGNNSKLMARSTNKGNAPSGTAGNNTASGQEVEMQNTGDTEVFTRKNSSNESETQYAKPMGEQTRKAMADIIAHKLKIDDGNKKDLDELY